MRLSFVLVLTLGAPLMLGCASEVSKFLGFGAPVTKERCEAMDLRKMGYEDGKTGQRAGEKFDFWVKDCRALGAKFDRAEYDQGYAEGMKYYCSCPHGFLAGVRGEYTEIKGQFFNCPRREYWSFERGHAAGKKYEKDMTLMEKEGPYKMKYFEDRIAEKSAAECPLIETKVAEDWAAKEAQEAKQKKTMRPMPTQTPSPTPIPSPTPSS